MTMIMRIVAGLAVLALLVVSQTTCVFACSCMPPGPPSEALANATAVFAGRVTALSGAVDSGGSDPVKVTFAISKSWKGAGQATTVITTPASSASCGVNFEQGQEYLVYASESEGQLQVNLCGRTTQLAQASEDLAVLGAGTAPTTGGAETPTNLPAAGDLTDSSSLRVVLMGAALLITLLGATVAVRQRRTT